MLLVAALAAAASGCGGGEPEPEPIAPVSPNPGADGVVVAALGDSIVAGSPLWDPQREIRAEIAPAPDKRSQFGYWAELADPELHFVNCGVFGERTDEIARRLSSCAEGADVLIVQGGINDIAQRRDPRTAAANLREMVGAGRDLGLEVALAEVLPWNNGHPEAAKPIRRLNAMIARIAERTGATLLPFYSALEDDRNRGRMRAIWTDDGDHPSLAGYRRLGELAVEPLLPRP